MQPSPETLTKIERARWLAELSRAIDEAQKLATVVGATEGKRRDAQELHAQLDAIRIEVEMLRRGRDTGARTEVDPEWIQILGWGGPRGAGPEKRR